MPNQRKAGKVFVGGHVDEKLGKEFLQIVADEKKTKTDVLKEIVAAGLESRRKRRKKAGGNSKTPHPL